MNGNPEIQIFSGSAHRQLALEIAAYLGRPLGDATVSSFPDGETFVKINDNVRGRDVYIVQPTCAPANDTLMELLVMLEEVSRRMPGLLLVEGQPLAFVPNTSFRGVRKLLVRW